MLLITQTPFDIHKAIEALRVIAKDRDLDQFHTPKSLAISVSIEANELVETSQWMSAADETSLKNDQSKLPLIKNEVADVLYYILRLSDVFEIDLNEAFWAKLEDSKKKYPVMLAKGNAKKHTEL